MSEETMRDLTDGELDIVSGGVTATSSSSAAYANGSHAFTAAGSFPAYGTAISQSGTQVVYGPAYTAAAGYAF